MKELRFRRYSILGQVGLWVIVFVTSLIDDLWDVSLDEAMVYALVYTTLNMATVYIHYIYLLPFFHVGQKLRYFVLTILLCLFFLALYYLIDGMLPFDYPYETTIWDVALYGLLTQPIFIGVSSLYYFVEAWHKNLQKENMLRSEKLESELNFLKSQINPHFLFNTLNNIYSFAQTGNEKTAPMLERLSSILRFMVYECSEESVPLVKELTAVEDLLEIYKMKNSTQQNIKMETSGVKGYHLIAPLIIVNFVENACKHSDAVNNVNGFIDIKVSVNGSDQCILRIENSVKKKVGVDTTYQGLGLENIKKRLQLQYGAKYVLEEGVIGDRYKLYLSVPLRRKN